MRFRQPGPPAVGTFIKCDGYGYSRYDATQSDGCLRYGWYPVQQVTAQWLRLGADSAGNTPYSGDSGGGCFDFNPIFPDANGEYVGVIVTVNPAPPARSTESYIVPYT